MTTSQESLRRDTWLAVALCAFAAFALGRAVQVANGMLHPTGLRWLTAALVSVLLALLAPSSTGLERQLRSALPLVLVAGLGLQFSQLLVTAPGIYVDFAPGWSVAFLRPLAFAAVAAGALVLPHDRARQLSVVVLLTAHLVVGVWLIRSSPAPAIDVFVFQRDAAHALLSGGNPYAMAFPNIYGESSGYYPPRLSGNGRVLFGFVYPPLSLLLATAGQAIGGDVRYAHLIAMTLGAALIANIRPGPIGPLAAALYLFTPRTFFVLEQSWTEPFVVLFLAATVFCAVRLPRVLPYALGLLLAVKQYTVLAVPVVPLLVGPQWTLARFRSLVGRAVVVALAISLPLALLDPAAFARSVVTLQVHQPFRPDSLSYLAWLADRGGSVPSVGISFVAAAGVMGLALWRLPRTAAGFALAVAAVSLVFFALNKQAFCNYYFFVIGALCVAAAAGGPVSADPAATRSTRRRAGAAHRTDTDRRPDSPPPPDPGERPR